MTNDQKAMEAALGYLRYGQIDEARLVISEALADAAGALTDEEIRAVLALEEWLTPKNATWRTRPTCAS